MAKQGMARPEWTKLHLKNEQPAVPQIQGKSRSGKEKAKPIVAGTSGPSQKFFHQRPIPEDVYPVIDNDLGRDNVENDMTFADLQDL